MRPDIGRHARHVELSDQLRGALASRGLIDQALGVMMAQQRCTASAAFELLRAASQNPTANRATSPPTSFVP